MRAAVALPHPTRLVHLQLALVPVPVPALVGTTKRTRLRHNR